MAEQSISRGQTLLNDPEFQNMTDEQRYEHMRYMRARQQNAQASGVDPNSLGTGLSEEAFAEERYEAAVANAQATIQTNRETAEEQVRTLESTVPADKTNVENIIGLPPQATMDSYPNAIVQSFVKSCFNVCRIIPAWPETSGLASKGLHIYSLNHLKGSQKYAKIISDSIPTEGDVPAVLSGLKSNADSAVNAGPNAERSGFRSIQLAYLNETSITETFNQEFGPSMFEEMAQMAGGKVAELRRITGANSGSNAIQALQNKVGEKGGVLSGLVNVGLEGYQQYQKAMEGVLTSVGGAGAAKLLSGSKVDFPQVWKGANYQTGHSITVRLYNPVPTSYPAYCNYIIIPLLRIIALCTPLSDPAAITYNMPVLCTINCTGLWEIKAGFVSSIEVIKGGEANDISFKQHPGMVDVRLSFGELYNVITTNDNNHRDRPTLKKYIQNMLDEPEVDFKFWGSDVYSPQIDASVPAVNTSVSDPTEEVPSRIDPQVTELNNRIEDNGTVAGAVTITEGAAATAEQGATQTNTPATVIVGQQEAGNMMRGIINGESNPLHEDLVALADTTCTVGRLRDNTVTTAERANELAEELALHTIREMRDSIIVDGLNTINGIVLMAIENRHSEAARDALTDIINKVGDQWLNVKNALPDAFPSALRGATLSQVGASLRLGRIGVFTDGIPGNIIQETLTSIGGAESNFIAAMDGGATFESNNILEAISGIQAEIVDVGTPGDPDHYREVEFTTYEDDIGDVYYVGASQQVPSDLELGLGTGEITGARGGLASFLWTQIPDSATNIFQLATGATYSRLYNAFSLKDMAEAVSYNPSASVEISGTTKYMLDGLIDIMDEQITVSENRQTAMEALRADLVSENVGGALDSIIDELDDLTNALVLKMDYYNTSKTDFERSLAIVKGPAS